LAYGSAGERGSLRTPCAGASVAKYSGTEVKVDGEEYLVMREEDVMAVLEK